MVRADDADRFGLLLAAGFCHGQFPSHFADGDNIEVIALMHPADLRGGVAVLPVNVSVPELDFVALVIGWGLSLA